MNVATYYPTIIIEALRWVRCIKSYDCDRASHTMLRSETTSRLPAANWGIVSRITRADASDSMRPLTGSRGFGPKTTRTISARHLSYICMLSGCVFFEAMLFAGSPVISSVNVIFIQGFTHSCSARQSARRIQSCHGLAKIQKV